MTPTHSSKHPPRSAPAVKMLITAASVAAMLGGWVAFSSQTPTTPASSPQSLESSLGFSPNLNVVSQPGSHTPTFQADQPVLRSVSAPPPAVITTTRSSR